MWGWFECFRGKHRPFPSLHGSGDDFISTGVLGTMQSGLVLRHSLRKTAVNILLVCISDRWDVSIALGPTRGHSGASISLS